MRNVSGVMGVFTRSVLGILRYKDSQFLFYIKIVNLCIGGKSLANLLTST